MSFSFIFQTQIVAERFDTNIKDLLLVTILAGIDPSGSFSPFSKNSLKLDLLAHEALFDYTSQDLSLAKTLCELIDSVPDSARADFLDQFLGIFRFPAPQELLLAVFLARSFPSHREAAFALIKHRLATNNGNWLFNASGNTRTMFSPHLLHPLIQWANENASRENPAAFLRSLKSTAASLASASSAAETSPHLAMRGHARPPTQQPSVPALTSFVQQHVRPHALFKENGPYLTSSVATFRGFLTQLQSIASSVDEGEIASILVSMLMTRPALVYTLNEGKSGSNWSPDMDGWNLPIFVSNLSEWFFSAHNRQIDWHDVVCRLDHPQLNMELDQKTVSMVLSIWNLATASPHPTPFPLYAFLFSRLWNNTQAQVQFVTFVVRTPHAFGPSLQTPRHLSNLMPIPEVDAARANQNPWCSVDLLETMIRIANAFPDYYSYLQAVFEIGIKHSAGILVIGLAHVRQSHFTGLLAEIFSKLVSMMCLAGSQVNTTSIFQQLWAIHPSALLASLVLLCQPDRSFLPRVLQLAYDLNIIPVFLKVRPFSFAIDFATMASLRPLLDIEVWIRERVHQHGPPFIHACLTYLTERASDTSTNQPFEFSKDVLQHHLTALSPYLENMDSDSRKVFVALRGQQGPVVLPGASLTPTGVASERAFPREIEDKANRYFQKIYTEELSIEAAIALLKQHKNSPVQREQEIFSCMIHNLFDEYRFFQRYPQKELEITANLFGALIHNMLVTFIPLGIALRYILEALRSSSKKMFSFGVFALQQFLPRLSEWPQYCAHLIQIPHLRSLHPELMNYIEKAAEGGVGIEAVEAAAAHLATHVEPPTPSSAPAVLAAAATAAAAAVVEHHPPTRSPIGEAASTAGATMTNDRAVDPSFGLLNNNFVIEPEENMHVPDQRLQDRIHFVFNNISVQDLMLNDLNQVLVNTETHAWFADYLVAKRASAEENFQHIHLAVLKELKYPTIEAFVLAVTYRLVKRLFLKSRTDQEAPLTTGERNKLKNLGKWLGLITIGMNRPILHRDLCLKDLVVDAFEREQLELVLPFVSRVLSAVPKSKMDVNNVWLRGILRLLAELHKNKVVYELKNPTIFEIELLFKELGIEITSVKTEYREGFDNPLIKRLKVLQEARRVAMAQVGETARAEELDNAVQGGDSLVNTAGRPTSILIDPEIVLFRQYPQLKKHCPAALDRALREIIAPVVDRSATIACITTRELVVKDFPIEGDLQATRVAAHHMVKNLAGNLALVTCKEILRNTISTLLRSLLVNACQEARLPVTEAAINAAVQQVCHDNIDLACAIVEKKATDKAIIDIDESLSRAHPPGQRKLSAFSASLPEHLRSPAWSFAHSGQVAISPHHLRVYEDFGKVQSSVLQQAGQSPAQPGSIASLPGAPSQSNHSLIEQLNAHLAELAKAFESSTWADAFAQLPSSHPAHAAIKLITTLAPSVTSEEQVNKFVSQIWNYFVESQTKLNHEGWFLLLQNLCALPELNSKIGPLRTTITSWLLAHSTLPRRGFWLKLIESHLVNLEQIDTHLSSMVAANSKPAIELSIFLLLRFSEKSLPNMDLPTTYQQLQTLAQHQGSSDTTIAIALAQIQMNKQPTSSSAPSLTSGAHVTSPSPLEKECRSQALALFDEWLQIQTGEAAEVQKRSLAFVHNLRRHAIFGQSLADLSLSKLPVFFQALGEATVSAFKSAASGQSSGSEDRATTYRAVDSYAKLLLLMLKCLFPDGPESTSSRLSLLGAILSSIVQVLINDHDSSETSFDQRPYFQLFSSILEELSRPIEPVLDDTQLRVLFAFSNAFALLSPHRVPGFVFAWLELVSRKNFMPKLLMFKPPHQAWAIFEKLLLELFKFLEPHLRHAQLSEPLRRLYKGTLRVLLVLLHDFPEFLCDYHFVLCDVLPHTCVQMRNLILSAFPRSMRLPDPFTPHLKVDLLPEIAHPPRLFSNFAAALTAAHGGSLKQLIDRHLQNHAPLSSSWTQQIGAQILLPSSDVVASGTRYNVPLINSLVLYLGSQVASQAQGKPPILRTPAMEIFQYLMFDLDPEGRYFVINAIANQLRYPNNHTHYFSCVLLVLFAEAPQEIVQEQITRVLLERVIVNRPHPWGLLITFIELIKNPQYHFWTKRFVTSAPEFKRLFESVSNICK